MAVKKEGGNFWGKCMEYNNYELIRSKEGLSTDTVLLIGNGAIENGSIPLENIVYDPNTAGKRDGTGKLLHTKNVTIHYLARMAYLYRSNSEWLLLEAARVEELTKDKHDKLENIKGYLSQVKKLRNKLEKLYRIATTSRTISLRDRELFDEFYSRNNTGIITINWDEVLWNDSSIENIIQLHGRCSMPDSLVLPTEMIIDTNIFKLHEEGLLKNYNARKTDWLSKFFKGSKEIRQSLENAHLTAYDWLNKARKLIIWGVAFNVYDAELVSLFQAKQFNELKEVVIVNPESEHRDIAKAIIGEGVKIEEIDPRTERIKN